MKKVNWLKVTPIVLFLAFVFFVPSKREFNAMSSIQQFVWVVGGVIAYFLAIGLVLVFRKRLEKWVPPRL